MYKWVAICFILYFYVLQQVMKKYVLVPSRKSASLSLTLLTVYIVFCPWIYSTFILGSTAVMIRDSVHTVSSKVWISVLHLTCGAYFAWLPYQVYRADRRLRAWVYASLGIMIAAGFLLEWFDPKWNDRLELSIGVGMPSLGWFAIISYGAATFMILIHQWFSRIMKPRANEQSAQEV